MARRAPLWPKGPLSGPPLEPERALQARRVALPGRPQPLSRLCMDVGGRPIVRRIDHQDQGNPRRSLQSRGVWLPEDSAGLSRFGIFATVLNPRCSYPDGFPGVFSIAFFAKRLKTIPNEGF